MPLRDMTRQRLQPDDTLGEVQADAQAQGINATPSIVVKGPSGTKLVGSGVFPLGEIRSAIGSVD